MRNWLRRAMPAGLVAVLALSPATAPALANTAPTPPIQAGLPAPTGHHKIGTVSLHLVDPTRTDPLAPGHQVREIMVQLWYPTPDADDFPTAPYMPPLAAAHFLSSNGFPPGSVLLPKTVAHEGAPVGHRRGPRPVVLYSPGGGADRGSGTAQVEDLASHGYIVVTMDHTHETPEVEFPGGRLELGEIPDTDEQTVAAEQIRVADTSFVIDQLAVLNSGGNPDAEHTTLPKGLAGSLDLSRTGMFGWSMGGDAAATAMVSDPRIRAGINLDGEFFGPVANTGVTRPFLLMTSPSHTTTLDPTLDTFLAHSTGSKLWLQLANSGHHTFSDFGELEKQVGSLIFPPDVIVGNIGTIDQNVAVTDERTYIRAFFDRNLRDRDARVLDGPSPRFPDIAFLPIPPAHG